MTTTQDKTRHTSGPWQVVTGEDWDGATVQTQGGRIVACCDGCDIPGATKEPTTEEAKANARLIAAAPEMLDALKTLHACHRAFSGSDDWTTLDDEARAEVEAIIAKAEGRDA